MALAPSLPPSPSIPPDKDALALIYVIVLVFVAMVAIFLLHILGPLRRRLSHGFLHHIVVGVYSLSYPLVGYIIGRMQSSNWYFNDFTVWAVFLLLLLSSTDSLTACRLSDIDNWKSIYIKQLFKGFLLVSIVVKFARDIEKRTDARYLWYPLSAILVVIILKSYVMIASMRMVSKSYLGNNMKVIAEYMEHIENKPVAFNPVTMEGYRYMVAGERHCVDKPGHTPWYNEKHIENLKVTTIEHIWQCKGNLLSGDRGKVFKDVCLSLALSKMLNRRFAGFKLSEAELEKTYDFVAKGLLAGEKPHQRAFRVIEQELVFVHDMYYTRYSYLYQKSRYLALCLPAIMLALCSWLAVTSLRVKHHDRYRKGTYRELMYPTIFITAALALLEAYQLYLYMASGWFKVALVRSYITTPFLQTSGSEMIIRLLLMLKAFHPWKGRLGQYCFLENLGRKSKVMNFLHHVTLGLINKSMKGHNNSVKLSANVKKTIVDSLLKSNGHLTNGVASLQRNGFHGDLSWACDATATDGAVSRTILVWHIATTLCEHQLDKKGKEAKAVRTASTLSKYCMHLLAFEPNFLPDHRSISESIIDQSIDKGDDRGQLGKLLEEANDLESRCKQLLKINTDDRDGCELPLVAQGVLLARCMADKIPDSTKRWKVLSDFWAEMLLYVSPSDDGQAHLEFLARGGEFITHLWALLTHAGVLKREPTGPNNVV